MVHTFKLYGQSFALDSESGAVHPLSDIYIDILRYLKLPFEDSFPSSLRYDLAKYESSKLSEAYLQLRQFWLDGVLMSDTPTVLPSKPFTPVTIEATVTFSALKPVFASEVIRLADSGVKNIQLLPDPDAPFTDHKDDDILISEYERIAKEIIKRKSGRIPLPVFDFASFTLSLEKDEKGYTHILGTIPSIITDPDTSPVLRRMLECAIAVNME